MSGSNIEVEKVAFVVESFCGSVTDLPTSPFAFSPFSPLALTHTPSQASHQPLTEKDIERLSDRYRGKRGGGGEGEKSGEAVFLA